MIDPENRQMVGTMGDRIAVGCPSRQFTREEALMFAAWLVVIARGVEEFTEYIDAVTNT